MVEFVRVSGGGLRGRRNVSPVGFKLYEKQGRRRASFKESFKQLDEFLLKFSIVCIS